MLQVELRFAWWLRPYLGALMFFCLLMQAPPDAEKLARVVRRAMRIRVR